MTAEYEIQIKGHLDLEWDAWFSGFTFTHRPDGTTLLRGQVIDQPALYALLERIHQLGLPLVRIEEMKQEKQKYE